MIPSILSRNPEFARLLVAQFLSRAGAKGFQIAGLWWILSRPPVLAGHGFEMSLLMVTAVAPSLFLTPWIARKVDTTPPFRLLGHAQLGLTVISLALWLGFRYGQDHVGLLLLCSLGIAFFQAVLTPSLNQSVPDLVRDGGDRESAVSAALSSISIAGGLGVVFGASLIDVLGISGIFGLNSLLNFVAWMLALRGREAGRKAAVARPVRLAPSYYLRFLRQFPKVLSVTAGLFFANFALAPLFFLLPPYVKARAGGTPAHLAVLEAAIWAGILVGNLAGKRIATCAHVLRVAAECLSLGGLAIAAIALWKGFYPVTIATTVAGLAMGISQYKFMLFFHDLVPDRDKGQFFSLGESIATWTYCLSYLAFGVLADRWPLERLFLAEGAVLMGVSWFFLYLSLPTRTGPVTPPSGPS